MTEPTGSTANGLSILQSTGTAASDLDAELAFVPFSQESQLVQIQRMIEQELSEPYSVYTYRYFLYNWPFACLMAMEADKMVGVVVCKLDHHRGVLRGYIAMLAVERAYRKRKIGSSLVRRAIAAMKQRGCQEVVLETEVSNLAAQRLYLALGFYKDKRLQRYYLNGGDAFRLRLWLA